MSDRSALPKHIQICELLIREIGAGRLRNGEKLPPERQMATALGASVGTLRKALARMTKQGLLERVQGSGNYVRNTGSTGSVYAMFRLELPGGGGLPGADILDVTKIKKTPDLPEFGGSDQGTRIRRQRFLNDTPIAMEEIWLDGTLGTLRPDAISESMYRTYQKQLGLWIRRAEDRVGIGLVPDWAPQGFGKQPGLPVGYVERFSWADSDLPVEYSQTWFDTDRARYVQRMN
jgi:GntR family transcriptional regulator